ncbi:MAG: glycosyltransferase [Candidatus Dojkabacteria bacterium]|nr:MAG: glycosyltransferase [Candidatus Dojkabacteria bacterium]
MKFSIVIPAKNEEKRLPATLASLCRFIKKESGLYPDEVEVIVVVNNTTDETYQIVKVFQNHFGFIRAFNIPDPIGKGGAIKYGFDKAQGDFIAYIDADGSSSPYELFRLFEQLEADENAQIAIADRYSKEATIIGKTPISRKIFSVGFRFAYHFMFGLKYNDTQCGLKAFRKEAGKYLMANNDVAGWTFDLNVLLMAKMLGLKVIDIPTVWEYKRDSTLNARKAFKTVPIELLNSFWKYRVNGEGQRLVDKFLSI